MFALHQHDPPAFIRKIGNCLLPVLLGAGAALVLLLLAGGPAAPAYAGKITFPGACGATIQQCIDGANTGDTLLISAGDYTESLTLSKAVSLTGALSSTTILHALPNTRVLTVTGAAVNSSVVISGLTFTGGNVIGVLSGGGMAIVSSAQPSLNNLRFVRNTASMFGGGLYTGITATVSGLDFISNTAGFVGGGMFSFGSASLTGGSFISNIAAPAVGGAGGGLYVHGAATLIGVVFMSNTAQFDGGGLHTDSTLAMTDTQFIGNATGAGGGGAFAHSGALRGVLFESNRCTYDPCYGGGLYGSSTQSPPLLTLIDTQFVSNSATSSGGGYQADGQTTVQGGLFRGNVVSETTGKGGGLAAGDMLALTGTLFIGNHSEGQGGAFSHIYSGSDRIINALFDRNSAGGQGEALFLSMPGSATILHTTIASPTLGSGAAIVIANGVVGITDTIITSYTTGISLTGGSVYEDYNLFFNVPVTVTGGVAGGGHSPTGNPAFRAPAAGDYHLTATSAAINAGTNAGVTTDFEGDPRPLGGFDIGYDEYVPFKRYLPLVAR